MVTNKLEVKYNFAINLKSRNSLKLINDRLKDNSLVLEFGPANGRLTKHMSENRNCIVDIVERNPISGKDAAQYARIALLGEEDGDIEKYEWLKKLAGEKYDFIIFADVLEHLYDPAETLLRCRELLKADGAILLSVPNIANNNVILSLLKDEFNYTPIGLLDDTHIRFFAYNSLNRLIKKLNYKISYADYTLGKVGETEIPVNYDLFSGFNKDIINRHSLGNIYQFIYELRIDNNAGLDNRIEKLFDAEANVKYEPICFYFKDGAYKSEYIIHYEKFAANDKVLRARFNISGLCNEGKLRFDPLEGAAAEVEIVGIKTDAKDYTIAAVNAIKHEGDIYTFITFDPIFEITGDFANASYIEFEYTLRILPTEEISRLGQEQYVELNETKIILEQLEHMIALKNSMIQEIQATRGYKILEKLRWIRDKIRA